MPSKNLTNEQINLVNSIIKNPRLNGKEKVSNQKMYDTLKALFNKHKIDLNKKQFDILIENLDGISKPIQLKPNLIEIGNKFLSRSKSASEQVSKMPKIKKGLEAAEVEAEERLSKIKYEPKKASVSNFVSPRYRFPEDLDQELKARVNNLDNSKRAEAIKVLEEKLSKKSSAVNNMKISDYAKKPNKAIEFLANKEENKRDISRQQTEKETKKSIVAEIKYAPKKKYEELAEKILTNQKKKQNEVKYKEGGERSKLDKKTISQDHAVGKTPKEAIEKSKSQKHSLNFDFNYAIKDRNFKEAANILEKLDRRDISKHGSKEVEQFIKDYDRLEKHLYREQKFEMFSIVKEYDKFAKEYESKYPKSNSKRMLRDIKEQFEYISKVNVKHFEANDMDKILDVAHEAYKMPKAEKSVFSKIVDSCVEAFKNVKNKVQGKEINTKIRIAKHDIPKDIQDKLKNALKNQKSSGVEAEPFDAKAQRSEKTKAELVKDRENKARKIQKSK